MDMATLFGLEELSKCRHQAHFSTPFGVTRFRSADSTSSALPATNLLCAPSPLPTAPVSFRHFYI